MYYRGVSAVFHITTPVVWSVVSNVSEGLSDKIFVLQVISGTLVTTHWTTWCHNSDHHSPDLLLIGNLNHIYNTTQYAPWLMHFIGLSADQSSSCDE